MNFLIFVVTPIFLAIIILQTIERIALKRRIKKSKEYLDYCDIDNFKSYIRTITFSGDSLKSLSDQVNIWLEKFPEIFQIENNIEFYIGEDGNPKWFIFIKYCYEKNI
jgi:hypothetical protein